MSAEAGPSGSLMKEDEAVWEAEDDHFSDWEEEYDAQARSLFDPQAIFPKATEALQYDREHHKFDLIGVAQALGLDMFGCIRLVNFIRRERPSADAVLALTKGDPRLEDESLFAPVIEDDALLQLDYDDYLAEAGAAPQTQTTAENGSSPAQQGSTQQNAAELLKGELERLREAYENLQVAFQKRIHDDEGSESDASDDIQIGKNKSPAATASKANSKPDHDSHYFQSYSENEIHEIMLRDKLRTESYRDFILHSGLFKDAIVLDVGCGTGILSLFAAQAGAKHVVAVDASEIALKAMDNVYENGLQDKITVVKGKVEEVQLPAHLGSAKVDIIVSEWMGYFCLYESMLDSVLVARDRFLKPGGLIAPSQCTMIMAAIDADNTPAARKTFWNEVYGYKMSSMHKGVFEEAQIDLVEEKAVISDMVVLKDVHILPLTPKELEGFTAQFSLHVTRDGMLGGFTSFFDTFFTKDGRLVDSSTYKPEQHPGEIFFSTCPGDKGTTHWKQTSFMLEEPRAVSAGDSISGSFEIKKRVENPRELATTMRFVHRGEEVKVDWLVR